MLGRGIAARPLVLIAARPLVLIAARPLVLIAAGLVLAAGTIGGIALERKVRGDASAAVQACIALAIDRDSGLTRAVPCDAQPTLLAAGGEKR